MSRQAPHGRAEEELGAQAPRSTGRGSRRLAGGGGAGASAYPLGLGARRRVLRGAGRGVGQVDLHVVRHFFQEVRRDQAFLPVKLPLRTQREAQEPLFSPKPTPGFS